MGGSSYDPHEGDEGDNGTSMWDHVTMRMQRMVVSTPEYPSVSSL